jgi:hypothetical protein
MVALPEGRTGYRGVAAVVMSESTPTPRLFFAATLNR